MDAARSARLTDVRTRTAVARLSALLSAAVLCVALAACSAPSSPSGADPASTPAAASPAPIAPAPTSGSPSPSATPPAEGADPDQPDPKQPVPKVGRTGVTKTPTQEADPATTSDPVAYPDGVKVRITDVSFGEETAKGPGSFPGRGFARLTLELSNGSPDAIDLGTCVLTVLDKNGDAVPPVYADEADVQDFSGTLRTGETATAVYAFAIPDDSHSQITLVVDFDAEHTSAVFRGGLN